MSKNKQTMKLYTEEQVKLFYALGNFDGILGIKKDVDEDIKKITPIELPSAEEINEVAMIVYGFDAMDIKDVLEYKAFKRGAKYVINKIQGGNK